MEEVLVSIAIPCYNTEKYLRMAIQSVLNQSYKNWELLILDDGSTDKTVEIAKEFMDERITIVCDGKNKGLPERLNESVSWAKGKYYARMDADDIMHYNRIKMQVDYLETHSDIDVLGTSIYTIDNENKLCGVLFYNESNSVRDGIFPVLSHPTIMGKLEWFKLNQYDVTMRRAQDKELWLRTRTYSKFFNLSIPLLYYREMGIPTFNKYCRSKWFELTKLYCHSRKYNIPLFKNIFLIIKSISQIGVCSILALFGRMDILVKMKNRERTFEKNNADKDLSKSVAV